MTGHHETLAPVLGGVAWGQPAPRTAPRALKRSDTSVRAALDTLTPRERVALTAVALGLTQPVASRRLDISDRTYRRSLAGAVERLGAISPAHAVALAIADGQLDVAVAFTAVLPDWPPAPCNHCGCTPGGR